MEVSVQEISQVQSAHAPRGNGFYTDERWLDLIQSTYGFTVTRLEAHSSDGALQGYLPVCALTSPLTGRRIVSLPFSDTCPLVAADSATAHRLVDQAIELGKSNARVMSSCVLVRQRFSKGAMISSPLTTSSVGGWDWLQMKRVSGQACRNQCNAR